MKEKYLQVFITVIFAMCLLFHTAVFAQDSEAYEEALISNAEKYWECGVNIQYDAPEKFKQSLYFSPEEATSSHICYTNCGAFVSALYMESFGIELPWRTENLEPYMQKNKNTSYVVDDKNQEEYTSLVKSGQLISHISGKIRPGDLIVCRFNPDNHKGHVMMVYKLIYNAGGEVADAWLIHSTGKTSAKERFVSAYNPSVTEGSVRISRMSKLLGGYYSKIVNDKSWVYYYGILRPLAEPGKWLTANGKTVSYRITDSTLQRMRAGTVSNAVSKKKSITTCKISSVAPQVYTGENVIPVFSVKSKNGQKLQKGKDYLITYLKDDNVKKGNAFVMVMGIGNYTGSKKVPFRIVSVDTSLKSVKKTKGNHLAVNWKRNSNASGYQLQISKQSSFRSIEKSMVIPNKKKTSVTVTSLKKGGTYYVRIRGYLLRNGKRSYGKWSRVKTYRISFG